MTGTMDIGIHQQCACMAYCGDVPEEDDKPLAVCKALPMPPKEPWVEVVLVHKSTGEVIR